MCLCVARAMAGHHATVSCRARLRVAGMAVGRYEMRARVPACCRSDSGAASFLAEAWAAVQACAAGSEEGEEPARRAWQVASVPHRFLWDEAFEEDLAKVGGASQSEGSHMQGLQVLGVGCGACPTSPGALLPPKVGGANGGMRSLLQADVLDVPCVAIPRAPYTAASAGDRTPAALAAAVLAAYPPRGGVRMLLPQVRRTPAGRVCWVRGCP